MHYKEYLNKCLWELNVEKGKEKDLLQDEFNKWKEIHAKEKLELKEELKDASRCMDSYVTRIQELEKENQALQEKLAKAKAEIHRLFLL